MTQSVIKISAAIREFLKEDSAIDSWYVLGAAIDAGVSGITAEAIALQCNLSIEVSQAFLESLVARQMLLQEQGGPAAVIFRVNTAQLMLVLRELSIEIAKDSANKKIATSKAPISELLIQRNNIEARLSRRKKAKP